MSTTTELVGGTFPTDEFTAHGSCEEGCEEIELGTSLFIAEVTVETAESSSLSKPPNDDTDTDTPASQTTLTSQQRRNVLFLVLAFSCVVAGLTLIVGTGALVIQSIGASTSLAPMALACFFLGMSVVSLTLTHWVFDKYGRKLGFWSGCVLTAMGAGIGVAGLLAASPIVVLLANVLLGAGAGKGMYLRFAAVEVVPQAFASKAVTWTLGGGCLAAFVGPEVASAVTGVFGDGNMTYLGVFVVAFCFNLIQAVFIGLVRFDTPTVETEYPKREDPVEKCKMNDGDALETDDNEEPNQITLTSLLRQSTFTLPLLVSVLSWSIMAQPMSIFRVTMRELGFTDRQSLTVIDFHFLSMYSPGFFSGWFIKKYGSIRSTQVAIVSFLIGTGINLSTQDNNRSTASWFLGLIFLGIGWNFGFSAATVWVTKAYEKAPQFKSQVQAANEAGTFFLAGGIIFSTGYIYNAGGAGLTGWRTLNYFILGLIALLTVVVATAIRISNVSQRDGQHALDRTMDVSAIPEKSQHALDRTMDISAIPEKSQQIDF